MARDASGAATYYFNVTKFSHLGGAVQDDPW